ncbi:cytochrome C biogenesis protein [Bacillus spongiae]|uniref:Cytochrome C biogenesis protein n=1 Tax=Bacillus spongiae TaxID=2683610 RepID=A0ABU8HFH6_9BACI
MNFSKVKVEVLLPEEYIEPLRNKLNNRDVLTIGEYDHVVSYSHVNGYWRPKKDAKPFNGEVGKVSFGTECKMEFRCPYTDIEEVKKVILSIHPYEEPIINVLPLLD